MLRSHRNSDYLDLTEINNYQQQSPWPPCEDYNYLLSPNVLPSFPPFFLSTMSFWAPCLIFVSVFIYPPPFRRGALKYLWLFAFLSRTPTGSIFPMSTPTLWLCEQQALCRTAFLARLFNHLTVSHRGGVKTRGKEWALEEADAVGFSQLLHL